MHTTYLVFPAVRAVEFVASAGAYVFGVPQPTAVCGLAHAFGRRLAQRLPAAGVEAEVPVLYAVRSFDGLLGLSRNPRTAVDEGRAKLGTPAPMVDKPRSSATLALVLEIASTQALARDPELPALARALLQAQRLQAASLFVQAEPLVCGDFATALRRLPRDAFVLTDEAAHLRALVAEGLSVADALAQAVSRPVDRSYKPWYVPVVPGYRALQAPSRKTGVRDNHRHAWCEPVLGLARFRTAAAALRAGDEGLPLLWTHRCVGDDLYVASGALPRSHTTNTFDAFYA